MGKLIQFRHKSNYTEQDNKDVQYKKRKNKAIAAANSYQKNKIGSSYHSNSKGSTTKDCSIIRIGNQE